MNKRYSDILSPDFTTTVNVVSEVLNMPEKIVRLQLTKFNNNQRKEKVDVDALLMFADKFCLKAKRYFEASIKAFDTLTEDEFSNLYTFCVTFGKAQRFTRNWRNIDKNLVKTKFLQEVKSKTKPLAFSISTKCLKAYLEALISGRLFVPQVKIDVKAILEELLTPNHGENHDLNNFAEDILASAQQSFEVDKRRINLFSIKPILFNRIQSIKKSKKSNTTRVFCNVGAIIFARCHITDRGDDDEESCGYRYAV